MTHYEELGVRADASETEIRHAYRQLSRLLHPDQQTHPDLRLAAERQMRRLNSIQALLTDPSERASYDASLAPFPNSTSRRYWWIAPVAATLILIAWPFDASAPPPRSIASASTTAGSRAMSKPLRRRASRPQPAVRTAPVIAPLADALPAGPSEATAQLPAPPPFLDPVAPPPVDRPTGSGIGGTWYFATSSKEPSDNLYSPEYIEAVVTERSGSIRGRYRARYRVGDRAISPFVAFEFEGQSAGGDESLPWLGPAGARGIVRLKMLADSRLEISWSAEHLGAEMGLAAGRAVLSRAR